MNFLQKKNNGLMTNNFGWSKIIATIALSIALCFMSNSQAQEFSDTFKEELQFPSQSSDNLLVVYNVYGSVNVEGYDGNTVQIEANLELKGNSTKQLDQGKAEIKMEVATKDNIIYVYLDTPYVKFNLDTGHYNHNSNGNQVKYKYTIDFKIKVPKHTNIELSAINNGGIEAVNIDTKDINVSNINGPITLSKVSGKIYANALNKDINITYFKNPTEESTFKSLNGDINIFVQKGLNADVYFKSLNGDIFTNMDTKIMPSKSKIKKQRGTGNGTKYKVDASTNFSIGTGGTQLNFELLNGDVTIKV